MKRTLLITALWLVIANVRLSAQQIKLGGNPFISIPGGTDAQNTFVGINAGVANSSGTSNSFFGSFAGRFTTSGINNTFIGSNAGNGNSLGVNNTFLGRDAGVGSNSDNNTFIGSFSGRANTTGLQNAFLGSLAGYFNTTGIQNSFIGSGSGYSNSTGNGNTFLGTNAGSKNTSGNGNVFIGFFTGQNHTTGQYNMLIGYGAEVASSALTNAAAIGANARVAVSNALVLGDPTNASMKVGIGTDSPQFPLDVRGIVNIRGAGGKLKFTHLLNPCWHPNGTDQLLTVNDQGEVVLTRYRLTIEKPDQWADRVFAPGYRLLPLGDTEQFIHLHGHLPGVPSADQVVREGVDMGTLNAKLLEKIEELTLYCIQLEKGNREQQNELSQVKQKQQAEIDELKRLVGQLVQKNN